MLPWHPLSPHCSPLVGARRPALPLPAGLFRLFPRPDARARCRRLQLGPVDDALKCNSNNCPTGITTQRPDLESGLDVQSKSIRVANYHEATVHSALEILAALGCNTPRDISPDMLFRRSASNGYGVESYTDLQPVGPQSGSSCAKQQQCIPAEAGVPSLWGRSPDRHVPSNSSASSRPPGTITLSNLPRLARRAHTSPSSSRARCSKRKMIWPGRRCLARRR
eukprot:scaffold10462_cov119-Isochrysis_galbana.AAC.10